MTTRARDRLRRLPPVHEVLDALDDLCARIGREAVRARVRAMLIGIREEVLAGADVPDAAQVASRVRDGERADADSLAPVINATGIVLHTGLGRAPLAQEAADAIARAAANPVPVEIDIASGQRGRRTDHVRPLLCELTGAEDATVVNNAAGALVLALATIATGGRVLVSRGELVEIGGSFRLPEIIEHSGSHLREVGTTNRTRLDDYARAISEDCLAILRVHPSNYHIEGFTQGVGVGALARLAHEHTLPMVFDIGSGLLRRDETGVLACEPDARGALAAGADLVVFSGDKLLGGPQAGVIVGRGDLVRAIERHPLMRALRVDKLTLAGLIATLRQHRDPAIARERIPVLRMVHTPVSALRTRAETMCDRLRRARIEAEVIETTAFVGGGTNPAQALESVGIAIRTPDPEALARALRTGSPGVFARVQRGTIVCDLRSVDASQDGSLCEVLLKRATESPPGTLH